jgi:hypothetical protein
MTPEEALRSILKLVEGSDEAESRVVVRMMRTRILELSPPDIRRAIS